MIYDASDMKYHYDDSDLMVNSEIGLSSSLAEVSK